MSTVLTKKIHTGILKTKELLNHPSSTKKTFHIELELEEPLSFKPGDSIGIFPDNDPLLVEKIAQKATNPSLLVQDKKKEEFLPFITFLSQKANLAKVTTKAKKWFVEQGVDPTFTGIDVVDYVEQLPSSFDPQELASLMLPQLPRYYSIASSPSSHPREIHLTVSYLEQQINDRIVKGVASHFLCYLADKVSFFLHPSKDFTLPSNNNIPILMIGPGTGIAPFRSFLYERFAQGGKGKNWLFFGERNESLDFYYQELFTKWEEEGKLHLTTAFSRDQSEKIYVQHRMWENRKEIWKWIESGAHLFVCGDAKKMAKEVQNMLIDIAIDIGGMASSEAAFFWLKMKKEKKFLLDVY